MRSPVAQQTHGHCEEILSIDLCNTFAWCDSSVVLGWLNTNPGRLNTFVSNRVVDTISRLPPTLWRYVSTKHNPADVASRGLFPNELLQHQLWWVGPSWLRLPPEDWPVHKDLLRIRDLPECKPTVFLTQPAGVSLIYKFSTFNKLLRVVAWCRRFVHNCHQKDNSQQRHSPQLEVEEIEQAETILTKLCQQQHFAAELDALKKLDTVSTKSVIADRRPFVDDLGLLRVEAGSSILTVILVKGTLSFYIGGHNSPNCW